MNYGYAVGASGVLAAMHRQDVAANNLANINTVGFKIDVGATVPRESARIEDNLFHLPSNRLLERLGAGVLLAPTRTSFKQGALQTTDNELDVAIQGDGFFIVGSGLDGAQDARFTRDGRFVRSRDGYLVMATGGAPVLDDNDRPIRLDPRQKVMIDGDGAVMQGGREVARLGLADFADRRTLRKQGDNLFAAQSPAGRTRATGRVVQNAVENSAADPVAAMMAVQEAANAASASLRMMQMHDELAGRAISSLGRVN
ncbi:MAG: flagellar hook basal-body protein [Phycisphaeraceae bacterium]|nr:flagellar hook basal-body protein [Phycisphaeraceae bacterium]MBX3406119.1 flagellar hook basal-body protein [Phycisphaeraceae bacterium]